MNRIQIKNETDGIREMIAKKLRVNNEMVLTYADSYQFMIELFKLFSLNSSHLVLGGLANPDILLASDQASLKYTEAIGDNPFVGSLDAVLSAISSPTDMVYLANPNSISGCNFSVKEIETIAGHIPGGLLIVDEYYFDFYGITALPLLHLYNNIVVTRNFTAAYGSYANRGGSVIGCEDLIDSLKINLRLRKMTPLMIRTIINVMQSGKELNDRLKELHDEALRLSSALNNLGVFCRITPGDFILLKVASPKDCGNFLNSKKLSVENLDGYPMMKKQLKYKIDSIYTNDRLIDSFNKMPKTYYKLKTNNIRPTKLKRKSELPNDNDDQVITNTIDRIERETEILTIK